MALTIDDLRVVREELYGARTKWYDIGLALHVKVTTLDSIEGQFDNHSDKLREALKVWLKTAKQPSWQDIVAVLESPVVGEAKLASDIKTKHCATEETGEASGPMMREAKRLKTTDTQLETLKEENRELRTRDQESQRRMYSTLQQELLDTHRRIDTLQQEIRESQEHRHTLQQELQESKKHRDTLQQELQESKKHRDTLQQELQESRSQIEVLKHQVEEKSQQQQSTEQNLLKSLLEHEQTIRELRANNQKLNQQLQQYRMRTLLPLRN